MIHRTGRLLIPCLLGTLGVLLLPGGPVRATDATDLCTGDPCIINGNHVIEDFSFLDFGSAEVILNGTLDVADGTMDIDAGRFEMTSTGQIRASGGGASDGGSVTMNIVGDVVIDGSLATGAFFMTGQDFGGSLDIASQTGSITGSGKINVDSSSSEGDAGDVFLDAAGDVLLTGTVSGVGGCCNLGFGGSGGAIDVTALGTIDLPDVNIRGADGGFLDLFSAASVSLGTVNARSTGGEGFGGDITANVPGPVTWQLIDIQSGTADGGTVDITSDSTVTVGDVEANGGGAFGLGGEITVTTTAAPIDVPATTRIRAIGAANLLNGGDGGVVALVAGPPGARQDLNLAGSLQLAGQGKDGFGGIFLADGDVVDLSGLIEVFGGSFTSGGGLVDVDATDTLLVSSEIDGDAGDSGGSDIALFGENLLQVTGHIHADAKGAGAEGGAISLVSNGLVEADTGAILSANGPNALIASGGDIELRGCRVRVASGVPVSATKDFGLIRLAARGSMDAMGDFVVGPLNSDIRLVVRDPNRPPDTTGATFNIPPIFSVDPLLPVCDTDEDGLLDDADNCVETFNPAQADADLDGQGDLCDNCILFANGPLLPDAGGNVQLDTDGDGFGNVCDCDFDQTLTCDIGDFNLFLPDFQSGVDSGTGTDMDGSGGLGIGDFNLFLPGFSSGAPGPSALTP